ncbi:MAG: transglutaminase family protein [Burkholderiaceae bacterium]|nr:transglutaminase family protein [Burkholderiaceae bacterium]
MNTDLEGALRPSVMVDADHPAVIAFAQAATAGTSDSRERAVKLYYAVRDDFRYDPYKVDLSVEGLKASRVLADGYGWCIPKAVLLAAACRAVGVPARLGLADVRNHLSTARLREVMGTDMFYLHGYTAIFLDGNWWKATPAFNLALCHKMRLHPLEFDGTSDSIYHPFDLDGQRHMEYVTMHGEFDDVPRDDLLQVFAEHYARLPRLDQANWDEDVQAEVGRG